MAGTNNFLVFGENTGANVIDQVTYSGLTARLNGFSAGAAKSAEVNKALRQGSAIAAAVGQYVADAGFNAMDDGDSATLLANLKKALAVQIDAQSGNFVIDTGAANAYVVAIDPPITVYPDGMTFRFRAANANSGASTLNAGAGAIPLRNNQDGALVAGDIPGLSMVTVTFVAALGHFVINSMVPSQSSSRSSVIQSVSASVSGGVLTVNYAGGTLDFPNATLANGEPIFGVAVPALTWTGPAAATLGTVSGQGARLIILVDYNAGTPVLCVANQAGGLLLDESNLVSPTTVSGSATSAGIIYSASSVVGSQPYRDVGFFDILGNTGSTWASQPTNVKGAGGQAFNTLASFGNGQTYQNVTASRALGTTYYNTTGRTIFVFLNSTQVQNPGFNFTVNGVVVCANGWNMPSGAVANSSSGIPIPPGGSYSAVIFNNSAISTWFELR